MCCMKGATMSNKNNQRPGGHQANTQGSTEAPSKKDIAAAAIAHGGSISACHGSCREGEVDLVPEELGRGFGVMLDVKRALDPHDILNPGKALPDVPAERSAAPTPAPNPALNDDSLEDPR